MVHVRSLSTLVVELSTSSFQLVLGENSHKSLLHALHVDYVIIAAAAIGVNCVPRIVHGLRQCTSIALINQLNKYHNYTNTSAMQSINEASLKEHWAAQHCLHGSNSSTT